MNGKYQKWRDSNCTRVFNCPGCWRGVQINDYFGGTIAGPAVWVVDVHKCICGRKYFIQRPYHKDYETGDEIWIDKRSINEY